MCVCVCVSQFVGPILIDTVNLSEDVKRATAMDVQVLGDLEKAGNLTDDRSSAYQQLLDAKTDISSLKPEDLLIRDLKFANDLPIAGFPMLVEVFFCYFFIKKKK